MEKMGYETELSFHQGFISVPVSAYVEMETPKHMSFRALTAPFSPSTPVIGLRGEIVEDQASVVAGKIVLAKGLPNIGQIHALQSAGAIGVLYAQDAELHNMPTNPLWGSPTEKTEGLLPKIPRRFRHKAGWLCHCGCDPRRRARGDAHGDGGGHRLAQNSAAAGQREVRIFRQIPAVLRPHRFVGLRRDGQRRRECDDARVRTGADRSKG